MPAPSPSTNPSRSASNGLEAFCGSSLRFHKALQELNPAMPIGQIAASAPPAIAMSTSPLRTDSNASPMESALLEQADTAL